MVSLYALCIMILAIGSIGIIIVLPNAWAAKIDCTAGITCYGTDGDDFIYGTAVADLIYGGHGFDIIHGLNGDDTIYGQEGSSQMFGGEGNDLIGGGPLKDSIFGGPGYDKIWGYGGDDEIVHGSLTTNQGLQSDRGTDRIDCGDGYDRVWHNWVDDSEEPTNCEIIMNKYTKEYFEPKRNEDCDRPYDWCL